MVKTCGWPGSDELMIEYHDTEWGIPNHDDLKWFELITLDAFQAGLSWSIVLKKRAGFRKAFDQFNPEIIADYNEKKVQELISNSEIIRNQLKIRKTISNAQAFLTVQSEFGSFDKYIWQFVDGKPVVNKWTDLSQLPAKTGLSDKISASLIKRGFKFVGSTICYAFMQSGGIVNDHLRHCFRYNEVQS
jgi:DNA-3-methyladenine glycosylase I